jgi:hypothetical protein
MTNQDIELHTNIATMAADMRHMAVAVAEIRTALPEIHRRIDVLERAKVKFAAIGTCAGSGLVALAWVLERLIG